MKFLSVGEMVIDFLPGEEEGVFIRKAGGAPANVAIAVARLGCDAGFCGMMGNDSFGHFLLETLTCNHVTPLVKELTDAAVTTMAFVSLDSSGDRSFTFARKPGADMLLKRKHLDHPYFYDADIVHAGSCSLSKGDAADTTVYALEEGRRRGKMISFDINYRDLLWDGDRKAASKAVMNVLPAVDLLKISEEEADMIGGEKGFFNLMGQMDISLIAETLGADGVRCFWNGKVLSLSGLKADCIDATGAGDAFWGGFIATLMKAGLKTPEAISEDLVVRALRCGNVAGWLCVQKKGAIESLPAAGDVERYLGEIYK